jgi:hypothetical protein
MHLTRLASSTPGINRRHENAKSLTSKARSRRSDRIVRKEFREQLEAVRKAVTVTVKQSLRILILCRLQAATLLFERFVLTYNNH